MKGRIFSPTNTAAYFFCIKIIICTYWYLEIFKGIHRLGNNHARITRPNTQVCQFCLHPFPMCANYVNIGNSMLIFSQNVFFSSSTSLEI